MSGDVESRRYRAESWLKRARGGTAAATVQPISTRQSIAHSLLPQAGAALVVRRRGPGSVGRQAVIMNRMIDEIYAQGKFSEQYLREFLGHTPVEVIAGAFLGVGISLLVCTW